MILVGSPLWALILQSDGVTWSILITLLVMSLISWTVALQKCFLYRSLLLNAGQLVYRISSCTTYEEMRLVLQQSKAAVSEILKGIEHVRTLRSGTRAWSYDDIQLLRDELYVGVEHIIAPATAYTVVLRIAAEAAPLLGLLGTIWGLIHSFVRISAEQSADILTVAPGIAEALITTLVGLLVAIPALLFFHVIQRFAEQYEDMLLQMVHEIERIMHRNA